MRGTIESLGRAASPGRIRSDEGQSFPFENNDILAYDLKRLRVGQVVNFQIDTRLMRAVQVSVEPLGGMLRQTEKREDNPLRLLGFDQKGTVRIYRFERVCLGQVRRSFVISIDFALLNKYRVAIQDGPRLCLRSLGVDPESGESHRIVTEQEIKEYVASRVIPAPRTFAHKRRPVPGAQPGVFPPRTVPA